MLNLDYLQQLASRHASDLQAEVASFDLKGRNFNSNQQTHVMGVINLSPDSWYRESVCLNADAAIRRGRCLKAEGADLIDLGAESTLLHASHVDAFTQTSALLPVIKTLSQEGTLLSVETYHPSVAEACLKAGAAVLNLTGAKDTSTLYQIVADHEAGVIICYVQGDNVRQVDSLYLADDHTQTLLDYFSRQIDLATQAGVKRIWIDPGLGFYYQNLQDSAARVRYQLETLLNTFRLRKLGWPVCHALPHAFPYFEDEVRSAESFFAVAALLGKTDLLRTHEVGKILGTLRALSVF
jgi:dihydropteroate synthase